MMTAKELQERLAQVGRVGISFTEWVKARTDQQSSDDSDSATSLDEKMARLREANQKLQEAVAPLKKKMTDRASSDDRR